MRNNKSGFNVFWPANIKNRRIFFFKVICLKIVKRTADPLNALVADMGVYFRDSYALIFLNKFYHLDVNPTLMKIHCITDITSVKLKVFLYLPIYIYFFMSTESGQTM